MNRNRIYKLVLLFVCGMGPMLIVGCGTSTGTPPTLPANPSLAPITQTRMLGDLDTSIQIKPRVYQPTIIEIRLRDPNGRPPTDIQRVDLMMAMEKMDLGAFGITAAPVAPGMYRAEGMLLGMQGLWYMALRVVRNDGKIVSGRFAFQVPPDTPTGATARMYSRPAGTIQIEDVVVYPQDVLPRQIKVQAQHPVRLEMMFVDNPSCAVGVSLPELNLHTEVSEEGLAEIEFVPTQNGTFDLLCKPDGLEILQ